MSPSFFVHKTIEAFADAILKIHGEPTTEKAFLFPSHSVAARCTDFLYAQVPSLEACLVRILDLYPNDGQTSGHIKTLDTNSKAIVAAVIFPRDHTKVAKIFWQHSGDGISSRRAEYCHKAYDDGRFCAHRASVEKTNGNGFVPPGKGPRRYQKKDSVDFSPAKQNVPAGDLEGKDCVQFVEERFGRNLDVSLASNAKLAIRRRIAGALTANVDLNEALEMTKPSTRIENVEGFSEDDVYLYPCGMSSIFNAHRTMMACRGQMKSISFG